MRGRLHLCLCTCPTGGAPAARHHYLDLALDLDLDLDRHRDQVASPRRTDVHSTQTRELKDAHEHRGGRFLAFASQREGRCRRRPSPREPRLLHRPGHRVLGHPEVRHTRRASNCSDTAGMMRLTRRYAGPPQGTGNLAAPVRQLLARCGGIVSTRELRDIGVQPTTLELYRHYYSLQAVRQGWHCAPAVPAVSRLSWRFGGPLACVSALDLHASRGDAEATLRLRIAQPLHVCVPSNRDRVPSPDLIARRWGIELPLPPVIHWSTADFHSGDRQAVSREVALRQADRCAALPD